MEENSRPDWKLSRVGSTGLEQEFIVRQTLRVTCNVLPTLAVGTITISTTTINSSTDAVMHIPLGASAGISNTSGITIGVGYASTDGTFELSFGAPQNVNLSAGQSHTFDFTIHVVSGPQNPPKHCTLKAVFNGVPNTIEVINTAVSPQLSVN